MMWLFVLAAAAFVQVSAVGVPGAPNEVSINDERIRTLHKYLTESNGLTVQNLELVSATVQVVSGSKTKLTYRKPDKTTCETSIWEQPWIKFREVTDSTCGHVVTLNKTKKSKRKARHARPENVLGGPTEVSINAEQIRTLHKYLTESNGLAVQNLELVSATAQVVSGSKTKLTYRKPDKTTCETSIWEQSWLKFREVTDSTCGHAVTLNKTKKLKRKARHAKPENARGAPKEVSINDAQVRILHKYLTESNGLTVQNLELVSATVQVVSGSKTKLTYRKPDKTTCETSIWEQPWLKFREVTDSTCGHAVTLNKTKKSKRKARQLKPENDHLTMFHDFMRKHNKNYETKAEYKKRFFAFKSNLKAIKLMNEMEQGTAKYGVNEFADLSAKEFRKRLGVVKPNNVPKLPQAVIPNIEVPDSFDWRNFNAVTPVKNQGSCGSCWAFSVTGNIEGQWAVQRKELLSLSEQEIVDCDKNDNGCGGGYMYTAYDSIVRLGGLESEKDYPYEGDDETCHLDLGSVEVTIQGGVNITSDETEMLKWLVQNGPISVGLNANVMQFYMGGVSHPFKFFCDPTGIDHGVLIVGYGVETSRVLKRTLPYWIIKNSWGKRWGELGYYRLYRGDGSCGINTMASSAVL